MIHYVHVVHVDSERAAAAGKALCLMFAAWLAWHLLPEGWASLDAWTGGWLGTLWHVISFPFVLVLGFLRAVASTIAWIVGAVDSAFHVAAAVQAVLLPVWALLAGRRVGRDEVQDGSILWLGAAGLNALCALLLGYPVLAGMVLAGSLGAFMAASALKLLFPGWVGWLAAALVAGLSGWGMVRYGMTLSPVCWLLVPLSWCSLALGAAYGVRSRAGGWLRGRGAVRLLVLALVVALGTIGPFAADAARAALLAGATPPTPVLPAPVAAANGLPGRGVAGSPTQVQQPIPAGGSHHGGQDTKPARASTTKHPRT